MNVKYALFTALAVLSAAAPLTARAESLNKEGEWTKTISIKRGSVHTFWVDGLTPDTSVFSIDVEGTFTYKDEDGDKQEDYVFASETTDTVDENGNTTGIYALLTADDWTMADNVPSSVSFKVTVSGFYDEDNKSNNSFSFHHSDGDADYPGEIEPPAPAIPVGADEDHPASLAFKETAKPEDASTCGTLGATLLSDYGNVYYVRTAVKLTEGRKYIVGLVGGGNVNLEIRRKGSSFDISDTLKPYTNVWADCSKAYELVPETSDDFYVFVLSSNSPEAFTIRHAVLPTRTPEAHNPTPIAVGETSDEFKPGYLNDPESGAYDPVIDQKLFSVSGYAKGDNIIFRTEGADSDLIMRLYDKSGKVLAENLRMGDDSREVSLAWTATAGSSASSVVYLGVCQNLKDGEVPSAGNVTVTATRVDLVERTTPLTPVPDGSYRSPEKAAGVIPSEERSLSATEWFNTFAIAARKGVTYRVKALGGSGNGLKLGAYVYTISGTAKRALPASAVSGSLDPESGTWLEITPVANGTVYIDVSVADDDSSYGDGKGLEYDPYRLYSSVDGAGYGILTVPMKGAPQDKMGWKILKKDGSALNGEAFYAAGTSAVLPAGSYTLVANKVDGFAAPDSKGYTTVTVTAGTTPKVVEEYKYTDTADPLDDSPDTKATHPDKKKKYSPTKLAPSASKPAVANRTLWMEDPADWFVLSASAGSYYKFALTAKTGSPKMAVYGPDNWTTECEYAVFKDPEDTLQICAAKKGTYYVKVSHLDESEPKDSSYTLTATTANPGIVKFAKTAVSVKDSAAYVDLSVSRTSKDGVVRVKYRTDGLQADKDDAYYYPTDGVLRWEAGDNKAKTIRVRLVPAAGWTTNRTFGVVLSKFLDGDATFDSEKEYSATFDVNKQGEEIDTAVVTVTASAKKTAGTIQVACDTPKKPVFAVVAGNKLEIPLERIPGAGGVNGVVGVKVEASDKGVTVSLSASEFVWADGEQGVKALVVTTAASAAGDYAASKAVTLKLTALASKKGDAVQYEKPALAASSVAVNVVNDKFARTFADYAKTVTAAVDGYTVKEGKAGSWVVRDGGTFYAPAKGDLSFKFSTTGTFTYKENGVVKTFKATATAKELPVKGASEFEIVGYALDGTPVDLWQGVKYEQSFGSEGTVKASKLPDGLKLAQDKATKEWVVSGVPSKAGVYQCVYTKTVGKVSSDEAFCYTVAAEGTAAGTFSGLATTFDTTNMVASVASVTFTAAAGGKLSAKVMVAGKSYSFADTGYVEAIPGDDVTPTMYVAELVQLQNVTENKKTVTKTNILRLSVAAAPEADAAAWASPVDVEIQMSALPDAKGGGFQEDVWYFGKVCRDNSKIADKEALAAWQAAVARFAGYYTVALVAPDAQPGEPRGSGYVTMTLDAKGKAKIAGKLADGTSYSASMAAALAGEAESPSVRVPLYACKGTSLFGGWLSVRENDAGDLVAEIDSPDTDVFWANDDPKSTRAGEEGFALYLQPVGGWYDTVSNLQRSYLESDAFVDLPESEDALGEIMDALALKGDYAFVVQPSGQAADIAGNTLSVAKQVLVKDSSKKLNDWGACVNASNVKLSFKRATGVVSGTFDLWYEGTAEGKTAKEQKAVTGLKHEGVVVLSRGDDGYLADDVLSSGFFVAPQKLEYLDAKGKKQSRTWNGSYRFDIKAVDVGRTWTDAEDE